MNDVDLEIRQGEPELAYIWRLGRLRDNGVLDMTWDELGEVLNRNLREPDEYLTESAYRKKYSVMRQAYEEVFSKEKDADELLELINEKNEIIKERIKLCDERTAYKAFLRKKAREESLLDGVIKVISGFEYLPMEVREKTAACTSGPSMLIPVTDVHCGELISNTWNVYDNGIMKLRFANYLDNILEIKTRHGACDAYVVLSELVSGVIHPQTRMESNENVIQQFLTAMNTLVWFFQELSGIFNYIHVYVAPGNHSRIFPNKEENRKGENMDNLALHFLKGYLQNYESIRFHENTIDEAIALFDIDDVKICAVHGDKDSPENVFRNITELTRVVPDIILMGHRHTNSLLTVNGGCKVIQSGCFSGTDSYCIDKRLNGRPEQAVAVINSNGLRCLYDIDLRG